MIKSLSIACLLAGLMLPAGNVQAAVKRPVMEEVTGTWCGWCTRGWIGMREMKKKYPDFIGVAYHSGDPMNCTRYIPVNCPGLPGCWMDRTVGPIDPFYGETDDTELGIELVYNALRKENPYASIEVSTAWEDEMKDLLHVTTTVTFDEVPDNTFKIGYILVQNGMVWPENDGFHQKNFYSGRTETGMLQELTDLPAIIDDFQFDDFVIYAEDCEGIRKSLPETVAVGSPYTHTYDFYTGSVESLQGLPMTTGDNDSMDVVALLINSKGKIMNAAKAHAGKSSGITVVEAANNAVPIYYDLQGREITRPANGIFIEKAGSKTRKIIL